MAFCHSECFLLCMCVCEFKFESLCLCLCAFLFFFFAFDHFSALQMNNNVVFLSAMSCKRNVFAYLRFCVYASYCVYTVTKLILLAAKLHKKLKFIRIQEQTHSHSKAKITVLDDFEVATCNTNKRCVHLLQISH